MRHGRRGAAFLIVGVVACGTPAKPKNGGVALVPVEDATDGGAPWTGSGCVDLTSRSTPLDVPNAALDGDLYAGEHHCYLDLQRPLCVRYPNDADGGPNEVDVRTVRLTGNCDSQPEIRFRGRLHGVPGPIKPRAWNWTVDGFATSMEHASRTAEVELSDTSAARADLLQSFVFHCWREGTVDAPTSGGRLILRVALSPAGEVTEVQRKEAVGVTDAVETCVDKTLHAPKMFLPIDAGSARELSIRIDFSLGVSPLR
ncbi:MAG TPA: hypothetical protein VGH28_18275 [Polyangiaceae bacterium]|jgi:hypothetical protein